MPLAPDADPVITPFPPSIQSVHLTLTTRSLTLGTATGFFVDYEASRYLVTNWHVLAGRHPVTSEIESCTGATPDAVTVRYLVLNSAGTHYDFVSKSEPLRDEDDQPLWLEHPSAGSAIDVAAIRLSAITDSANPPYDPWALPTVELGVGDDLKVVGFPFGISTEGLAVWTHGYIASEYEVDHDDRPMFLVDARTRKGQSGSPAIWFRTGGYLDKYGGMVMPQLDETPPAPGQPITPGRRPQNPKYTQQFLGVYAGRITDDSDIGRVWRPSTVQDVLEGGTKATAL